MNHELLCYKDCLDTRAAHRLVAQERHYPHVPQLGVSLFRSTKMFRQPARRFPVTTNTGLMALGPRESLSSKHFAFKVSIT